MTAKLTIIFFLVTKILYSQHIYVKPLEPLNNYGNPGAGLFIHSSVTINGLNVFDTSFSSTNVIRSGFGYSLMNSTSFSDAISRIMLYQNRLTYFSTKTQNLIIEIAQTPKWVSTSTDTTTLSGSGWRYYSTVKPNNYQVWDSLMKTISLIVKNWGFQVNFEFWNEPDLLDYWNGSQKEFLELYIHSANAMKSGNPYCNVGGIAVNYWYKGIKVTTPQIAGWWSDSLANVYSVTGKLIDTCYLTNTPLNFITYHNFAFSPELMVNGYQYFRKKLNNYGMQSTKLFVTEYNSTSSYREATVHAPYMINAMNRLDSVGLNGYAIATLQDFSANPNDEFFNDYGIISRNAIIKPAYLAAYMIDKTVTGNQRIKAYCDEPLITIAYKNQGKIKLIVANKMFLPLTAGYEVLYYGGFNINTFDLINAGYTSNAQIENTIKGLIPPIGPPNVVNAFIAANANYDWVSARYNNNMYTQYQIHISGLVGQNEIKYFYVDSTHNNNVFRYDSLRTAGYSNNQAVNYLINNPVYFNLSNRIISDSVFTVNIRPNTVYYFEIPNNIIGIKKTDHGGIPGKYSLSQNYPNPFNPTTKIKFSIPQNTRRKTQDGNLPLGSLSAQVEGVGGMMVSLKIFDILGKEVAVLVNEQLQPGSYEVTFDGSSLPSGIYFYQLRTGEYIEVKKMLLVK